MLTPRNFITLVIALAVLSVVAGVVSLLGAPDGDGLRADSYGTRAFGHRAILESLQELNVPVQRLIGPPSPQTLGTSTYVLWNPRPQVIQAEPAWLDGVRDWVQRGGHVVVASGPGVNLDGEFDAGSGQSSQTKPDSGKAKESNRLGRMRESESVFSRLGLPGIKLTAVEQAPSNSPGSERPYDTDRAFDELYEQMRNYGGESSSAQDLPQTTFDIRSTGNLTQLSAHTVSLPKSSVASIDTGEHAPDAELFLMAEGQAESSEETSATRYRVAASFSSGQGRITVVSVPALISNSQIRAGDNGLLAVELMLSNAPSSGQTLLFDEFFHGLSIRGNVLWLFAQRTYGTITLCWLMLLAVVIARSAVFLGPPLADAPVRRRSILEYVHAMARFLSEARNHGSWIAQQFRDGILWSLRREVGLPPEQHDVDQLLAALERRNPQRAQDTRLAVQAIDNQLAERPYAGLRHWIPLLKRMNECLSKNVTERSATKSQK